MEKEANDWLARAKDCKKVVESLDKNINEAEQLAAQFTANRECEAAKLRQTNSEIRILEAELSAALTQQRAAEVRALSRASARAW